MKSVELAKKIVELASEVKAIDPVILDLEGISSFTDFFVVCSASSDRQTRAICDKVEIELKKDSIYPTSVEGYDMGTWIVIDYFDVVLHVFTEELRKEYDLEGFWEKAKRVKIVQKATAKSKAAAKKSLWAKEETMKAVKTSPSKKVKTAAVVAKAKTKAKAVKSATAKTKKPSPVKKKK